MNFTNKNSSFLLKKIIILFLISSCVQGFTVTLSTTNFYQKYTHLLHQHLTTTFTTLDTNKSFLEDETAMLPPTICSGLTNTEISGMVWEDWNYDGIQNEDRVEGVANVTVTLIDDCNNIVQTAQTDAAGNYSFTGLTTGTTYRIEFALATTDEDWLYSTKAGSDNGTFVQFRQPGECASLGVSQPSDFCAGESYAILPCFVGQEYNGTFKDSAAIVQVDLAWSGNPNDAGYNKPVVIATHEQVGSTYGIAHHPQLNHTYVSSFFKRGAGYGPNGPGAIYQIDQQTGNVTLFADVNTLFVGNPAGTDIHDFSGDPNSLTFDDPPGATVRRNITKISFGDIDLSITGDSLFAVNLFDKKLYIFPTNTTPTATNVTAITLPQPTDCIADDTRPFATGIDAKGNVYVGFVCSNESLSSTDGLYAYVYRWDGGTAFTEVLDFDLTFDRGAGSFDWEPWGIRTGTANRDDSPILSDIEFDRDDMVLGFRNRLGDAVYNPQVHVAGDIYRACWDGTQWNIEDGGICGGVTGAYTGDTTNPSDPGGPGGGHFYDNEFNFFGTPLSQGGVMSHRGQIIDVANDVYTAKSAGLIFYDETGSTVKQYEVFRTSSNTIDYTYGKANGLGDIEGLCGTPPLEIGNRIWRDDNDNGIQDACEEGISNVAVELLKNGTVIATTTTNSAGQYYFSSASSINGTDTWTGTGIDTALIANTTYTIRISNAEGSSQQTSLADLRLTTTDVNSNNNDLIDNDANLNNDDAEITATTRQLGYADHNFDFGFRLGCPPSQSCLPVTITKRLGSSE